MIARFAKFVAVGLQIACKWSLPQKKMIISIASLVGIAMLDDRDRANQAVPKCVLKRRMVTVKSSAHTNHPAGETETFHCVQGMHRLGVLHNLAIIW